MPAYNYKARDSSGKLVKGTMDAPAKAELIDKLQKMGYMTTGVTDAAPRPARLLMADASSLMLTGFTR